MSAGFNRVVIVGNLGQDPEIRTTSGGDKVATLSLATSPPWNKDKTEWHRAVAWGKKADLIEQYVSKGDRLLVEGRLQYNKWEDKDGRSRVTPEINVENITFLGDGGRRSGREKPPVEKGGGATQVPDEGELPF